MMLVRVAWTLMGRSAGLSRVARIPQHVINGITTAVPGTAVPSKLQPWRDLPAQSVCGPDAVWDTIYAATGVLNGSFLFLLRARLLFTRLSHTEELVVLAWLDLTCALAQTVKCFPATGASLRHARYAIGSVSWEINRQACMMLACGV